MDPELISYLINPIIQSKADFVKGNRFLHQIELKKMPFVRRIGNWALTFLVKSASGYWQIFDPTNGFTTIHANFWELPIGSSRTLTVSLNSLEI